METHIKEFLEQIGDENIDNVNPEDLLKWFVTFLEDRNLILL